MWSGSGAEMSTVPLARMREDDAPRMEVQLPVGNALGQIVESPPYFSSPRIGVPICAMWARSWCWRPVTGFSDTQAATGGALSMHGIDA